MQCQHVMLKWSSQDVAGERMLLLLQDVCSLLACLHFCLLVLMQAV